MSFVSCHLPGRWLDKMQESTSTSSNSRHERKPLASFAPFLTPTEALEPTYMDMPDELDALDAKHAVLIQETTNMEHDSLKQHSQCLRGP